MLSTVFLTVCILFSGTSCQNSSDLFVQSILASEDEEIIIEEKETLVISEDFDWNNIPDGFSDAIWDIQFDFDLKGETIILPENVTLYFSGGSLRNGVITGDESEVISKTKYQVFNTISLSGTFIEEQYLVPYWFGAVMDGITDDRDVFVETLAQAHAVTAKIMVDQNIFLDVEELGKKSIFIEDNTWIEGKNGANIIINSLYSPAFYMALVKDITIKNVTFLYDNSYDAGYDWSLTTDNHTNQQQLENYLSEKREIIFNSTNPIFKGTTSFHTIFSLEGSENILYDNVIFKAKGTTANTFMQFVFKFKEQYNANQTINSEAIGLTSIPSNITFNNITFDGTLMGVQGNVNGFVVNNLKSYRYSDMQNIDGSNLGAFVGNDTYRFPPPHLFYLNTDSAINDHFPQNIELKNIIDYGEYVGTVNTRGASGYCNSLKMVGKVENVLVDNYSSYRRDGLGDLGDITNGEFKNLYGEYTSDIFNSEWKFNCLRFVGPLTSTVLENITLKDNSDISGIYPLDFGTGDYVTWDNIQVSVKELNTNHGGFFGIFGSNNTIINSSLSIEEHTSEQLYMGLIYHDEETLKNGSNNHYEITVNGWRNIDEDVYGQSCRMLFANSSNTHVNYAKVTDVSNNMIIEQVNNIQKDIWTRTEIVDLGYGTSQKLDINIPSGFMVQNISANTLEGLASGIEVSIGTSTSLVDNLMDAVSKTQGVVSKTIAEITEVIGNRYIYLNADGDFNNTGKVEITVELTADYQYD